MTHRPEGKFTEIRMSREIFQGVQLRNGNITKLADKRRSLMLTACPRSLYASYSSTFWPLAR